MSKKEKTDVQKQATPESKQNPGRAGNPGQTTWRLLVYLMRRAGGVIIALIMTISSTAATLYSSYLLKGIIDDFILRGDSNGLFQELIIYASVSILGAIASAAQGQIMVRVAQKTISEIREELFKKLQKLPVSYFDQRSHGDTMSLFTNDIDTVQMALEQSVIQLFSGVLMLIGSAIMMLSLSPTLFIVTIIMLVIMIFLAKTIGSKSRSYFQDQQSDIANLNGYLEEMVEGQKVVQIFNYEDRAKQQFETLNEKYRKSGTLAQVFAGIIMPLMNNMSNINFALTTIVGGVLTLAKRFTVGKLVAYMQYVRNFTQPIQQITNQMNNILNALAGAERIFEAIDQQPEQNEGEIHLSPVELLKNGEIVDIDDIHHYKKKIENWAWQIPAKEGIDLERRLLKGDVRFHNVTFGYDESKPVLKGMSLFAKPGEKIAFVGTTGAGKTTITNLINRFYEVQKGYITFDGIDIKNIDKDDLRNSLGMVLQDTHLFTGTIADNIRYGRLEATDQEVKQAAKMTSADVFIRHLPDGYNTMISGDGDNLSQGQRQLLAIARAAVANPPVLILDEATSSIDTRTEKLINDGMDALMKGRTVFVIAHRLSTIRNAAAILVIEHGEIIERGTHEDLMKEQGRYYQLNKGIIELE